MSLKGSGGVIAKQIWENLDEAYRVALCVRETDLSVGSFELFVINAENGR